MKMTQQWVAMGVVVVVMVMSVSMATAAECKGDEERINQGRGGRQGQCEGSRLSECRDFIRGGRGRGQDQPRRMCCEQLQQMPRDCRCDAVKEIFEEEQQQYGMGMGADFNQQGQQQQQQRRMAERARQLPSRCNVSPRQCDNIHQRGIYMPGNMW